MQQIFLIQTHLVIDGKASVFLDEFQCSTRGRGGIGRHNGLMTIECPEGNLRRRTAQIRGKLPV